MAIAKKEFQELIHEKVYIVAFFVQMFLVVGIVFVAYLYSSISTPEAVERFVPAQQVKVCSNYPLDIKGVSLAIASGEEAALRRGCVAFVDIPEDFEERLSQLQSVRVEVLLDNTNMLSAYAYAKIQEFFRGKEKEVIEKAAQKKGVVLPRVRVVEEGGRNGMEEFIQLMYGILIPFILLLPTFIASNMTTDLIVGEKEKKTYELLISSPATRLEIVLGKALPVVAICTAESFLWIRIVELRGLPIYNEHLLLGYITLLNIIFFSFGIAISAVSESVRDANSLVTFLLLAAGFGIFAPLSASPTIQELSPAKVISNLASNPVPLSYSTAFVVTALAGVLTLFLSVKLMEKFESLRV